MFDEIYGNVHSKKLVESMINQNRLVHTIILTGDKGLGKLTFAKAIAKEIIYKNHQKNISIENCVDINIIDGNITGSIIINDIREIKNKINISPHQGDQKIQIIANCEKMTIAAQNALLKSLEEPSKTTIFILTTSNINKLLDTISSRAVIIKMQKISENETIKILSSKYPQIKINDIIKYVKIFDGNIGLIKSILDDNIKQTSLNLCEDLLFYIFTQNQFETMKILSKYKSNKQNLIFFLELFKLYFEKILKIYLCNNNLTEVLNNHDPQYFSSLENKIYICDLISKSLDYLSANVNLGLILTWLNINLLII